MGIALFNKVKKNKKFGRSDSDGAGFAVYANVEVIKAEYSRDDEQKIKTSKTGSKAFNLVVRTQRKAKKQDGTEFNTGEMMFIRGYEREAMSGKTGEGKDWSMEALKLKDLKPETTKKDGKDVITSPKFIRIMADNGGDGAAGFSIRQSISKAERNKGDIQSSINLNMPNIEIAKKVDGKYMYKGFGKDVEFKVDERAYVRLKGFFAPIKSTEDFIEKNVNKEKGILKTQFYYQQSEKKEDGSYYEIQPITLMFKFKNFDEDVMGEFGLIKAIKTEYKDKLIFVEGHLEQVPIFSKAKAKTKRQFGKVKNGEIIGYDVALIVTASVENEGEDDEWVSFSYSATGFDGKLIVKKEDAPLVAKKQKTETEKTVDEEVDEEDIEDVNIEDDEIEEAEIVEEESEEEEEISEEEETESEEETPEEEAEEIDEEEEEEELPPPPPKKKASAKKEEPKKEVVKEVKKETPKKAAKVEEEKSEEGISDEDLDANFDDMDFDDIDMGDMD